MITLLAFIVAIGLLVTFHELGHFTVAKLLGVKVLRFSIGLGRPLLSRNIGETEWVICPIPLGGYVKMLDEREGPIPVEEQHRAFNRQSVFKRMAIVVAGPLANFLLAIVLYFATLSGGVTILKPWIGSVTPQTPAAMAGFQSGDRLLSIGGEPVRNWQDIRLNLMEGFAVGDKITIDALSPAGQKVRRVIDISRFDENDRQAFMSGQIGLSPLKMLPVAGALEPGGPAERAGFKPGDRLISANGRSLSSWEAWVELVHNSPGQALSVVVQRSGKNVELKVRPTSIAGPSGYVGRIGLAPQIDAAWNKVIREHLTLSGPAAFTTALDKTWENTWVSLKLMGWMVTGHVSWSNLSGPLTIANVAGQTAQQGWTAYLEFLALISISIGILNLLPIPVLDGGHLMYYTAELIKGSPLSEHTQRLGERIGVILLFGLMLFALFNDLSRLFGG
jgi:regulator of sigma E protease